jgi:hypothetical protein
MCLNASPVSSGQGSDSEASDSKQQMGGGKGEIKVAVRSRVYWKGPRVAPATGCRSMTPTHIEKRGRGKEKGGKGEAASR